MNSQRFVAVVVALLACRALAAEDAPQAKSRTIVVPAGMERAYDEYHYAPAVRVGDLVIVSGVPAGRGDTYEEQIRNMFERVKKTLAAAGADMSDIVELQTFHSQVRDSESFQREFAKFLQVHQEYFAQGYPAWTAVGTTALLSPGAPVEMRVVAVVGSGKGTRVERASPAPKPEPSPTPR